MITLLIVNTILACCIFFVCTYLNHKHGTKTDSDAMGFLMFMFIPPIGTIIAVLATIFITINYVIQFGFFIESKLLKFFDSRKLEKK